ncbi:MAG: signal peptidase II [Solirubrobacteraceae bacterium]
MPSAVEPTVTTMSNGAAVKSTRAQRALAFARVAVLVVIVVVSDQVTKHAVIADIPVGTTQKFLPAVNLVHIHNSGVAFGFFAGGGAVVLVLTLTALSALIIYFLLRPTRPWLWLPTGLLVGGALGNLIDRISHGYVTDFVKLPAWPAFNLSDMAITFGVLSLLYVLEGAPSKRAS